MLDVPLEVMRPASAHSVPAEDALPGGVQFSVKLDGFRIVALHTEHRVVLQTRAGNNIADRYPEITRALADMTPEGSILDGELVATDAAGKSAFAALASSPVARSRARIHVHYIAFDLLAASGQDLRALPLAQRWARLEALLAAAAPPLGLVLATTDRAEAISWMTQLAPLGVEGIVAKGLGTTYNPRQASRSWIKVRHADTIDARAVALIGSATRPSAVVLQLADGRTAVVRLSSIASRQLAAAARNLVDGHSASPHPVHGELLVEVRALTGRHQGLRFVRVRDPQP